MILTGRAGLVALIYVLPIAVSPWPATTFVLMLATLVAGVLVDVLLAGSPRALRFTRFGETAARLGQPVEAHLRVHNEGSRRFRGMLRDAWPPSAGAEPRSLPLVVGAGQPASLPTRTISVSFDTPTNIRPFRRNATPPNIFFSVIPRRPLRASRIRSARWGSCGITNPNP